MIGFKIAALRISESLQRIEEVRIRVIFVLVQKTDRAGRKRHLVFFIDLQRHIHFRIQKSIECIVLVQILKTILYKIRQFFRRDIRSLGSFSKHNLSASDRCPDGNIICKYGRCHQNCRCSGSGCHNHHFLHYLFPPSVLCFYTTMILQSGDSMPHQNE